MVQIIYHAKLERLKSSIMCVCVCVCARACVRVCAHVHVCVVSVMVKRPVLPPRVVDGCSRNPLYYYYYYYYTATEKAG